MISDKRVTTVFMVEVHYPNGSVDIRNSGGGKAHRGSFYLTELAAHKAAWGPNDVVVQGEITWQS